VAERHRQQLDSLNQQHALEQERSESEGVDLRRGNTDASYLTQPALNEEEVQRRRKQEAVSRFMMKLSEGMSKRYFPGK